MIIGWTFILLRPSAGPQPHTSATCLAHGRVYSNVEHQRARCGSRCEFERNVVLAILSRDADTTAKKGIRAVRRALDGYGISKRKSDAWPRSERGAWRSPQEAGSTALSSRHAHSRWLSATSDDEDLSYSQGSWSRSATIFIACHYRASP